ncbi:MAG: gamma-glutamylcyclotransferase [Oscillospiraceae bacterium]|jgi:hypothetical protein|nr:gamma-glutamylcyclotransferase [Oscillospiraceae bacterium]
MSKNYIAYGSNLNVEDMKMRCPDAKPIGRGVLENHELTFRGKNKLAVASVQPLAASPFNDRQKYVPVVIWEISDRDEDKLDYYEDYPKLYIKQYLYVKIDTGEEVRAMAYIINEHYVKKHVKGFGVYGKPNEAYLSKIRKGYEYWGFDLRILNNAIEQNNPGRF